MTMKRIISLIVSFCILTVLILSVHAVTAENYVFYEDFEGVTYNVGFDSPLATGNAKQRWSSEVAGDSTNHYMKYTIDTDVPNVQGQNSKPYELSVQGSLNAPLYPLDRNAWYEAGYRFDMNDCTPYLNSFCSFMISDAYGGVANVCVWSPRNTTLSMNNGYNDSGEKENITVTLAEVDGFITTKIFFNMHGDTETAQNYTTNGEAIVEVTYKKTDGSSVYEKRRFEFQTNRNGAEGYRFDRFRGLSANEISCTSGKGSSFFLDDIYIKEIKTYSVTFDKNDGSGDTIEKKSDLTSKVELPEVSREGYRFDGWYKDSALTERFDENNVQEELTVYAKWLKLHKVTFEKNGGIGADFAETVTDSIEFPTPPTKKRYDFNGWFKDSELTIPFDGTGITEDITVYAKWVYAWEISFNTNGGEPLEPRYAVSNLSDIPTAEWIGYRFDGWYTDEELTSAFDGSVTADMTVYAKWTKKYIVTFESNGGSVIAPIYTLEDLAELPVPEKQGCTFEGWFLNKELTKKFDGTGITGDLTVYAAYNNIIFYEDFEDTDGLEYMKQLAPTLYEEYIKQGCGVVDDGTGNKALRLAFETSALANVAFPDGGEGLYEITYKIKVPKNTISLFQLMSPRYKDQVVISTNVNNYIIFNGKRLFSGVLNGAADYIDITYMVDTINNLTSIIGEYINIFGKTVTDASLNTSFSGELYGIDGLSIVGAHVSQISDYYIDDICVKKIDQPKIEAVMPEADSKDIPIDASFTLQFSEEMDNGTITADNVYITDVDGNILSSEIEAIKSGGKTTITLTPSTKLSYDSQYFVKVNVALSNGTYNLDKNYVFAYETVPQKFQYKAYLMDESGENEITDLVSMKDKSVNAVINLRNFAGDLSENYFVSAALVDIATGKQLAYRFSTGTIARGEKNDVLNASIAIPSGVTDKYKVKFYFWDSVLNRNVLWNEISLPQ